MIHPIEQTIIDKLDIYGIKCFIRWSKIYK